MNLPEATEGFSKMGWTSPVVDKLATRIHGTPVFDVFAFEDFLHDQYGDYESDEGLSTQQLVEVKFGKEAVEFCEKAFAL